jgi:hypothetical protein
LWGASCCVMYTYTFQIYLRSQLRIYWCYFFSLFTTCFGPYRPSSGEIQLHHLHILKKPSILLLLLTSRLTPYEWAIVKQRIRCSIGGFFKICKWCSSARMGRNMLWTGNKSNTNKFSVAIAGILERYTIKYGLESRGTVLARTSSKNKLQTRPLVREGATK